MIFLNAQGIMGNISFKILNNYAIEGQGMAEGIYIKEGYEKQYYKSLIGIYVITSSKLNVREGPGTSMKVLGELKKGDRVDVIEVVNKHWYKVMTGSGEGYVSSAYLQRSP